MRNRKAPIPLRRRLGVQALEKRELLAARISELLVDPHFGDNNKEQYVELRGEPNQTLEQGTYLLVVSERRPNAGEIHGIFDLSSLSFGSNGYMVFLQNESPFEVEAGATVLQSTAEGFGGLPGDRYTDAHPSSDRIDFIIGANAYILVQTDVAPVLEQNIDGNGDGEIDESVLANWNILDSVSLHPFVGRGDYAFGKIVFAEIGTGPGDIAVGDGVELIHTEGFGYGGRIGESMGSTSADWIQSTANNENLHTSNPPRWAMADNLFGEPSQYPYAGRDLDHVGGPNFVGGVRGMVTGSTGEPLENVMVLADTNQNGVRDSLTYVVDPDDVIDPEDPDREYPLINAYPGVTVTNFALGEFPAFSVTAEKEKDFPNTLDNRIFAKGGIDWFSTNAVLRFDFYRPVNSVSVVAIGDDNPLSKVYARLEAYDAEGELLGSDLSGLLVDSARQTISVNSNQDNIAYVFAYADEQHLDGGPFGRFDRMSYSQLEPAALTDENGYYEIRHLFPRPYTVTAQAAGLVDQQRSIEVVKYENFVEDFTLFQNRIPTVDPAQLQISENAVAGSTVGSVVGNDPDGHALTYSLFGTDSVGFEIDASSGVIRVGENANLNFESKSVYNFSSLVTDPFGAVASAPVTVEVNDLNERPSVTEASHSIFETAEVGEVVGTVEASDPDTSQNQTFTYQIVGGTGAEDFAINAETGQITVNRPQSVNLDTTKTLLVRVSDSGTPSLSNTATINVLVRDVNQEPSIESSTFELSESAEGLTQVGVVTASDPDLGQTLRYSIVDEEDASPFFIEFATGIIRVKEGRTFDFEAQDQFEVEVVVTDNGAPVKSSSAVQVINITDANEVPSIESTSFSVEENSPLETEVGVVQASDPDDGQSLTFEIIGGTGANEFEIDSDSGSVTVAAELDFEVMSEWTIEVKVSDNGEPSLSTTETLTVEVGDVNEPPVIISDVIEIEETASGVLAQLSSEDPDVGQTLTYELIGGSGASLFEVTPSGEVVLKAGETLDFETDPTFTLNVRVRDNGADSLSAEAEIEVNVTNINEEPEFESQPPDAEAMTGEAFGFSLADNPIVDPEGDDWEIEAFVNDGPLPDWLSFDAVELAFSGIPTSFYIGTAEITLRVFDPNASEVSSLTSFQLTIAPSDTPLHNLVRPGDVNGDDDITAVDALRIINYIARPGSSGEVDEQVRQKSFYDVTGDNMVTARDALVVINEMARLSLDSEAESVGAPAVRDEDNDFALLEYLADTPLF